MTVGSAFQVNPAGSTVAVLVYQGATAVTFYFDQACTLAATAPSITTTTVFYVLNPGAYSISLKVGGVEMATPDGNQLTIGLSSGSLPTLTPQAQAAGATGVARLIAGTAVTLSPSGGTGTVTVSSTASGLPTASAAGEVPVSTGPGTTYAASSGAVNVLGSGVTSYTLALSDTNGTVVTQATTSVAITLPDNASVALPVPCVAAIIQGGAGPAVVTAAGDVYLNGVLGGTISTSAANQIITLTQWSANTWTARNGNPAGTAGGALAGTYPNPTLAPPIYYAKSFGVIANDSGGTDYSVQFNAMQKTISAAGGGIVIMPEGRIYGSSPFVLQSYVHTIFPSWNTCGFELLPNSNCDVCQTSVAIPSSGVPAWATSTSYGPLGTYLVTYSGKYYYCIAPAAFTSTIIPPSDPGNWTWINSLAGDTNAFFYGLDQAMLDGNAANQSVTDFHGGWFSGTYPNFTINSTTPDVDFDTQGRLTNVYAKLNSGHGFNKIGRGEDVWLNCWAEGNGGDACITSVDMEVVNFKAEGSGLGGMVSFHTDGKWVAPNAFQNGQTAQWVSGSNYAAGAGTIYNGSLYKAINALTTDTTVPSSDPTNWNLIVACPEWGVPYYLSGATNTNIVGAGSNGNAGSGLVLHQCTGIVFSGDLTYWNRNPQTLLDPGSNPNDYCAVVIDDSTACNIIAYCQAGSTPNASTGYVFSIINGATHNLVNLTDDGNEAALLSPASTALLASGNIVTHNGVNLTSTLSGQNDVTTAGLASGDYLAWVSGTGLWTPTAAPGATKGTILAEIYATSGSRSATSTTLTALDTTNFTISFTAITTAVDIDVMAGCIVSANGVCNLALLQHVGGAQVGDTISFSIGTSEFPIVNVKFRVTGLTVGNSYQYDLAAATAIATFTVTAGAVTGYNSTENAPLSMRAIAA